MGFERPRASYLLRFRDDDLAGLEVRVRAAPMGTYLALSKLAGLAESDRAASAEKLYVLLVGGGDGPDRQPGFVDYLDSWNLTDGGAPVPADAAGLLAQEFTFVLAVVLAWLEAISQEPAQSGDPGSVTTESEVPGDVPDAELESTLNMVSAA